MLRPLLLALLLANAALLLANLGGLDQVWPGALQHQREPERLARQLNLVQLQLLPAGAAASAAAGLASAASTPVVSAASDATPPASTASAGAASGQSLACVQTGPMAGDDRAAVEQLLLQAGVTAGAWRLLAPPTDMAASASSAPADERPTTWLIVMGRYADPQVLQRKQEELRRLKVEASTLSSSTSLPPGVVPGLLLGRYAERAAAEQALVDLGRRGVHTARLVAFRSGLPAAQLLLQLPQADAALQARLAAMVWPVGQSWVACSPDMVAMGAASAPR